MYSASNSTPVSIAYEYDYANDLVYSLHNHHIYGFTVNRAIDDTVKYKSLTTIPPPTTPQTEETEEEYEYYDYEYEEEEEEGGKGKEEEDEIKEETRERGTDYDNEITEDEKRNLDEEELIPPRVGRGKSIENEIAVVKPKYLWRVKGWTDCSVTCGEGEIPYSINNFNKNFS